MTERPRHFTRDDLERIHQERPIKSYPSAAGEALFQWDRADAALAENARHQNTNLVQAVTKGWDEAIDGAIVDYINAEGFDPVPWLVAAKMIESRDAALAENERYRTALELVRSVGCAFSRRDAWSCDPSMSNACLGCIARAALAEGDDEGRET